MSAKQSSKSMSPFSFATLVSASLALLLLLVVVSSAANIKASEANAAKASQPLAVKMLLPTNSRAKRSFGYETEPDLINLEPLDYELAYRLNQKRGLDLGLSRGFSGNQAAKHMLGLAAANMAHGPGKRASYSK